MRQRRFNTRSMDDYASLAAWAILVVSLWASANIGWAQDNESRDAGFEFLTIGGGARAVGFAETMAADDSDPFVLEYNPAGLSGIEKTAVAFSHNQFYLDSRGEYVTVGVPVEEWSIGARAGYFGVDDFALRTGPSSEPVGFFDASSGVFQAAVARRLNQRIALGISGAYVLEHIYNNTAHGAIFGLGMLYRWNPDLTLGASLINFGPRTSFIERDFRMPMRFRFGAAYHYRYATLRGEMVAPDNENVKWHFGTEVSPDPKLFLRVGAKLGYDTQTFAAGFGVRTPDGRFGVDYAFAPYDTDFGATHRYGLVIRP